MNNTMFSNRVLKFLGICLMLMVLPVLSIGATTKTSIEQILGSPVTISDYQAAQNNTTLNDEDKIKMAIDAYFSSGYEGQKTLKSQDITPLIDDNTQTWVKKEKDKREIEQYLGQIFDLKYKDYSFTLEYGSIEIKDKNAVVQLSESSQVVFDAIAPEVSEKGNIPHVITLHKKNDSWLISKDDYQDELLDHLGEYSKEEIKNQIDENYQKELKIKASSSSDRSQSGIALASYNLSPMAYTLYSYHRTPAWQYAEYYWNDTFNPAYRLDPSGNDCANFVSQAINAGLTNTSSPTSKPSSAFFGPFGTWPPGDSNWSQQWYYKFYTSGSDLSYSASFAWENVVGQYNFITTNNWTKGPTGYESESPYVLTSADVIQIKIGSDFDHEGIVVGITGDPTNWSNWWIDAHTTPRHHYPLSYWMVYQWRGIHITGGYK